MHTYTHTYAHTYTHTYTYTYTHTYTYNMVVFLQSLVDCCGRTVGKLYWISAICKALPTQLISH